MKAHRLIQILGETAGLIALAAASMNCASPDASHNVVPDAGPTASDAGPMAANAGPATCTEAKTTYRVSVDGPQILYVNGDKTMPWSAYCADMATPKPAEYLELDTRQGEANFSEFSEGGYPGFTVKTQFRKIRIDPAELSIDSTDKKFTDRRVISSDISPSTNSQVLSRTVDYMPYAVAESCITGGPELTASANVDLSSSPFEIANAPCGIFGDNTVTGGGQKFEFRSYHNGSGGSQDYRCGRASLNCLPDPTINGEVGGEGKIRLRYGQSSGATRTGPIVSGLNTAKCVDLNNASATPGSRVQIFDCNGVAAAQSWTINGDGTITIDGGCLQIAGHNSFNGTPVQWWTCTGGSNQQWQAVNGQLINPATGKCLDDPSGNTANGTELVLWDCNGGMNQQWRLP